MNLRDKLRAVEGGGQRPQQPQRQYTACWQRREMRPMEDFPRALEVRRETVMLMQGEEMPEGFDPRRILYLDT